MAFAFVVTIICLHYSASRERKIYTAIASAFAIVYCTAVTIVYFTELAVVIPQLVRHKISDEHLLAFKDGSFMVAVDCIGYAIMSLSTLFAAFAFKNVEGNRWLYRSLLYNGLLTPVVIAAFFVPAFLVIGALWMITLPTAMINAAKWFRNKAKRPQRDVEAEQPNSKPEKIIHYEFHQST